MKQIQKQPLITAGYCHKCRERTGQVRFRQLYDGICADCCRAFNIAGPITIPKPRETAPRTQPRPYKPRKETSPEKEPNQPAKPKLTTAIETAPKNARPNIKQQRVEEETKLQAVLDKMQLKQKQKWIEFAAKELDWSPRKTKTVGRRLVRKKIIIKKPATELIEEVLIKENRSMTLQEILSKIHFSSKRHLYDCLQKMWREGKVEKTKINHRSFYSIKP